MIKLSCIGEAMIEPWTPSRDGNAIDEARAEIERLNQDREKYFLDNLAMHTEIERLRARVAELEAELRACTAALRSAVGDRNRFRETLKEVDGMVLGRPRDAIRRTLERENEIYR